MKKKADNKHQNLAEQKSFHIAQMIAFELVSGPWRESLRKFLTEIIKDYEIDDCPANMLALRDALIIGIAYTLRTPNQMLLSLKEIVDVSIKKGETHGNSTDKDGG